MITSKKVSVYNLSLKHNFTTTTINTANRPRAFAEKNNKFYFQMFPFKTKAFFLTTDLTVDQLKERLETKVIKRKIISVSNDGELWGTIKNERAIVEFGQGAYWNSFRPIVVFQWTKTQSGTEIRGYYRIDLSVIIITLFMPLFGLYLSISILNIFPFLLLLAIWVILYRTFALWAFNRDFKWTQKEFFNLVK